MMNQQVLWWALSYFDRRWDCQSSIIRTDRSLPSVLFQRQLPRDLSPRLHAHLIKCVFEGKQERSCNNTLGDFRYNALVKSTPSLLSHNSLETPHHAVPRNVPTCHMHPALHRNIWVRDTSRQQLAKRSKKECVSWRNSSPLLKHIFQLFKYCVLQYRIYYQNERRQHPCEKCSGTISFKKFRQSCEARWFSSWLVGHRGRYGKVRRGEIRLGGCHPRVDNPYWIRNEDSGAASDSSSDHRFDGCELLRRARATNCCTFEEGTSPLIPWIKTLSASDSDTE